MYGKVKYIFGGCVFVVRVCVCVCVCVCVLEHVYDQPANVIEHGFISLIMIADSDSQFHKRASAQASLCN
jgi:hypothetical protein